MLVQQCIQHMQCPKASGIETLDLDLLPHNLLPFDPVSSGSTSQIPSFNWMTFTPLSATELTEWGATAQIMSSSLGLATKPKCDTSHSAMTASMLGTTSIIEGLDNRELPEANENVLLVPKAFSQNTHSTNVRIGEEGSASGEEEPSTFNSAVSTHRERNPDKLVAPLHTHPKAMDAQKVL